MMQISKQRQQKLNEHYDNPETIAGKNKSKRNIEKPDNERILHHLSPIRKKNDAALRASILPVCPIVTKTKCPLEPFDNKALPAA